MLTEVQVRKNNYYDSMVLLRINAEVAKLPGVLKAGIMMGTERNKLILKEYGFWTQELSTAGPGDMIICLTTSDPAAKEAALGRIEEMAHERIRSGKAQYHSRSLESALARLPEANLATISIPGDFAAREARKCLRNGLHVFLFSDHVSLEEEIELKQIALKQDLLLMGPDCGTAIVNGVRLGFANVTRRGPVGIVGASGTGIQEFTCLLERYGNVGLSHALGIGGRDLSDSVGGLMAGKALELLENDEGTDLLVLISKPPGPRTAEVILERAAHSTKPVIINFIGKRAEDLPRNVGGNVTFAGTLDDAAQRAMAALKRNLAEIPPDAAEPARWIAHHRARNNPGQKYLRGVFSGGSLCLEAWAILRRTQGEIYSNVAPEREFLLADPGLSVRNSVIDLGEDEFTRGKVHPMIDPTPIAERLVQESKDPEVAVLLFDVILGSGAHPNPSAIFVEAIQEINRGAQERKAPISILAHVCGTAGDPQGLAVQESALRDLGVFTAISNQRAVEMAEAVLVR